jgi:hypothetical protein
MTRVRRTAGELWMGMSPQKGTSIQTGHQWLVHYKQRHRVRTLQCMGTAILGGIGSLLIQSVVHSVCMPVFHMRRARVAASLRFRRLTHLIQSSRTRIPASTS